MSENVDKIYQDLTGVDIKEQYRIWDERGKGYYGEYLVFKSLYPSVDGVCKFLMNIEVPTANGRTTEIDLLMIHESGLYVFEMKHYKGTIYGKADDEMWTQYFRTAKNNRFKNPILQNEYHIKALRDMFPNLPIYSCVIFTSQECELRVNIPKSDVMVCNLYNFKREISRNFNTHHVLDMGQIDAVFQQLTQYAPMMQQTVTIDGVAEPLYLYINNMRNDYQTEKRQLEENYEAKRKRAVQTKYASIIVCVLCIGLCIYYASGVNARSLERADKIISQHKTEANEKISQYKAEADEEIKEYKEEAERAQEALENYQKRFFEASNNTAEVKTDLVIVSNVVLEDSSDLVDTTILSFDLSWNGTDHFVTLSANGKCYVSLRDGTLLSYNLYKKTPAVPYSIGKNSNIWHKSTLSESMELHGVNACDIEYIKFSDLAVRRYDVGNTIIDSAYEIEIYKK